jgi:hypothetical protein
MLFFLAASVFSTLSALRAFGPLRAVAALGAFRRFLAARVRRRDVLRDLLAGAVARRRVERIDTLLSLHGPQAFALAVSALPPRVAADALSVLPEPRRQAVLTRLPGRVHAQLPFGKSREHLAPPARGSLQGLLLPLAS